MSILLGAVMPRQKTAFASEGRIRRAAVKHVMATQTSSKRCIVSSSGNGPQCYAGFAIKPRGAACFRSAKGIEDDVLPCIRAGRSQRTNLLPNVNAAPSSMGPYWRAQHHLSIV